VIAYLKRLTIRNIVSPYGLAMISYCIFLFAWLFPPGLYTEYIHEPDLMFMDPKLLLFYSTCVAAFLYGVRVSRLLGSTLPRGGERLVSARSPLLYLLAPLVVTILYCSLCLMVLGGQINFVVLLAAQQGDAIKAAGQAGEMKKGMTWGPSIPALTGVLWWSLFRMRQLSLKGAVKTIFYLVFFTGVGIGLLTCIATVDRTNLMPIILGLSVVYLHNKTRARNASVVTIVTTGVLAGVGAAGTFLLLSFLRGALAVRVLINSLLGYTIVSYNRTAALLSGAMHYAWEGRGVYLSQYLLVDRSIDAIFHLGRRFGWPDFIGLFLGAFSSTMAAGLNPEYVWSGAFGLVFSDIGWWTVLYLCLVGTLAGCLWSKFNAGKTSGLILYPWLGFSVLIWFGPNILFAPNFILLCEFTVILSVYDRLFLRQAQSADGASANRPFAGPYSQPVTGYLAGGVFDAAHR
jgi:hypothetical protein